MSILAAIAAAIQAAASAASAGGAAATAAGAGASTIAGGALGSAVGSVLSGAAGALGSAASTAGALSGGGSMLSKIGAAAAQSTGLTKTAELFSTAGRDGLRSALHSSVAKEALPELAKYAVNKIAANDDSGQGSALAPFFNGQVSYKDGLGGAARDYAKSGALAGLGGEAGGAIQGGVDTILGRVKMRRGLQ